MSAESSRNQNILWWIASIATSVLCCSILFVLFASYIVDIKGMVETTGGRMNVVEEREDRILSEIEMVRKHMTVKGDIRPAEGGEVTGALPVPGPDSAKAPENPPNGAPSAPATSSDAPVPTVTPPAMPVPLAPTPADKK